jgi:glycosyltransferase involved in cell wall biosynthesis
MNPGSLKIAAVLPRYGASIGGGAETLVRELLLSLLRTFPDITIEVLTTCARDHRTWDNYYPEGNAYEDGVQVRRFRVSERDLSLFIKCEQKMAQGFMLTEDEQLTWLENSVNSNDLYRFLRDHCKEYDLVLYAPYLFGTSFWGPMLSPDNAVLVPCLHDEVYAYLPVFRYLFRSVVGLMWNAHPEAELADRIYRIPDLKSKGQVVGMGFDMLPPVKGSSPHDAPFILYAGRKETGKNLDYLISCYQEYRKETEKPFDLVLTGSGAIDFLETLPEGVIDKGFVTEEEKRLYFAHAALFIQPSVNESFSIVLMEAWRENTPVLVHADCAVTADHVSRSGGGMWFRSVREFIECIEKLHTTPEEVKGMAEKGREYVAREYSWEAVHKRFLEGVSMWKK